jgi:hypothetical protein
MLFAFITASVLLFAVDLIMDKIETMRNLGNKIEPVVKLGKKFIHPSENCKQKKREKLYEKIDTICAISYAQQSCQEDVFTDREVFIGLFNQKCANAFDELNLKCFGGKNEEFQRKAIEYRKKSDDCQIIIDKIKGSTSLLK